MSVGCKGKGQTEEAASAQKCFGVFGAPFLFFDRMEGATAFALVRHSP
jgi:hypothetical protein